MTMLCQTIIIPAGAADEEKSFDLIEAEKLLSVLEIIPELPNEDNLRDVSRAEFSVWLARVIGINDYEKANERYFTDVEMEHWATKSINYLASRGVIAISSDRKFRPEEPIKLDEAIKMLLCIMGYEPLAKNYGGYPEGYQKIAAECEMYRGLNVSQQLNFSSAKLLLYNALRTYLYDVSGSSNGNLIYQNKDDTLLSRYWNIYEDEGFVTGDYVASIIGNPASNENGIVVDRAEYICGDNTLYDDMLGKYVHIFYMAEDWDADDRKVITLSENTKKEKTQIIKADDIDEYRNNEITYYDGNRKRTVRLENSIAVVYNGVLANSSIDKLLSPKRGTVRLCDTDKNGGYDLAVVWEYENLYVGGTDYNRSVVYDYENTAHTLSFSETDYDKVQILSSDGTEKTFGDIRSGIMLSVYDTANIDSSNKFIKAYICEGSASGNVDKIGDDKITVSGSAYDVDMDFFEKNRDRINTGISMLFLLDIEGKIAAIGSGQGNSMTYGYILNNYEDEAGDYHIKLYTQNGEFSDYECNSSMKIDGYTCKNSDSIFNALSNGKTDVKGQLVRFSLNKDGQLKTIDTLHKGNNENEYSLIQQTQERQRAFFNYAGCFDRDIVPGGGTLYMIVPDDGDLKGADINKFSMVNMNYFDRDHEKAYTLKSSSYTIGKDKGVPDIVLFKGDIDPGYNQTGNPLLVTEIMQTINDNDELIDCVSGYEIDSNVTYNAAEGVNLSDTLTSGDLITLRTNLNGEITGIEKILRKGNEEQTPLGGPIHGNYQWNLCVSGGYAISVKDNVLAVGNYDMDTVTERISLVNVPIVIYDAKVRQDRSVEVSSADRILTYEMSGSDCSRVIITRINGVPKCVYIWI